ncbi:MAG TPA: transglutaminase-like domain-containing protein [Candidatus Angelobacter sp.]|nr:transglutaminase-like domain-containing protein [Candidatus Angelobacter sp.]
MLRRISVAAFCVLSTVSGLAQSKSRHFELDYSFTVRITDPGKPLDIWFPIAQSDPYQQVRIISRSGDLPLTETTEPEYGNRMFYAHADKAGQAEYHFSVKYDVVRLEHLAAVSIQKQAPATDLARFLRPDRLVPITGKPAELAAERSTPGMSDLEKGRAFYEYVFSTMKYDKTGTGWGKGDTLWACDAKRGNCTDFHSVFISMARSQKVPARFEMGLSLPEDQTSGQIAGYHCWAEFYTRERGWFPVDISEAWKHQEKKSYFFGAHDVNRVQFTVGRDIELRPKQHAERVNYLIFPYVELDGQPYPNVANAIRFSDLGNSPQAQRASR